MASLGVYRGLISAIFPFLKSSTYEFFKVKLIEIDFICILLYFKGFTMLLMITATYVFRNTWNPGLNTCTTPCRSSQIFFFPTLKFKILSIPNSPYSLWEWHRDPNHIYLILKLKIQNLTFACLAFSSQTGFQSSSVPLFVCPGLPKERASSLFFISPP